MGNREKIKKLLENLLDEINEIISPHESIRDGDDQYEDPEMWWAYPVKGKISEALSDIDNG